MTFTSESGTATFEPLEFENKLSEKFILPQRKYGLSLFSVNTTIC